MSFLTLNIALILLLLLCMVVLVVTVCLKEYKNLEILLSQLYSETVQKYSRHIPEVLTQNKLFQDNAIKYYCAN